MTKVSKLITGADEVTTIDLQWVPQFLLVGDVMTDLPLKALSWNIAGDEKVHIGAQALIQAFSKLKMNALLGADVQIGQILQIADGYIPDQQFQLRLTNVGADVPDIFAFSLNFYQGKVMVASPAVINDGASQGFSDFMALQFDATNVTRVEITFFDPDTGQSFQDSLTPVELDAMFSTQNQADANGQLSAITTIDGTAIMYDGMRPKSVRIYASGANVTVSVIGSESI